jgi:hypothetical protein
MQAEIPDGALELASLMHMNGGDLTQLAKFRIGQNGRYRSTGLPPAATMGALGFVLAGSRHLTGVGWVQRERVNATTTALQRNHRRSNRGGLGRHRKWDNTAASLGTRSTTTSHCEKILWEVSIVTRNEVGILLLTDASREDDRAVMKEQLEIRELKAEM